MRDEILHFRFIRVFSIHVFIVIIIWLIIAISIPSVQGADFEKSFIVLDNDNKKDTKGFVNIPNVAGSRIKTWENQSQTFLRTY